ncbi:MAG TPA: outer membrane beta-barrel protein [Bradyrhizobium sp.]|uniref:outer membrane protein n=1 Tax=Bradyrhizobium sp. TaxID=376 RepID=UPI002D7F8FEF|nr:outer membrane beta-barrel protein [Bradyrhizobium sp.]HET7886104.1 outer membrane beta-barrel protein [Bradyrhizobium sp.]
MKKIIVTATLLASSASIALAAPPTPPAPGWTGTYGGITGGWGWGTSSQTDPGIPVFTPTNTEGPPADGRYGMRGGLFGGSLGSNWQMGSWVYGLEGDLSWSNLRGSSNVCGPLTATPHPCGTNLDALGTFRGRIGYAAGPGGNWLLYATGGLAVGDIHGWDALTPASGNVWRAGWTLGAGVETMIAPNLTAKLEYLYVDLGNGQVFNVAPGIPESVGLTANIVRAGISYKFGSPAAPPPPPLYTKAPYTKAPIMAGSPWSGWYGGVNVGYVDGADRINTDATVLQFSTFAPIAAAMAAGATSQLPIGNSEFIGGGQVGYNWALSPKLLVGVEADIQDSSLSNSAAVTTVVPVPFSPSFVTNVAASRSVDYLGTVRGRLGATVTPTALLYVTGGLAYGGVKSSTTISQTNAAAPLQPNAVAGTFSDTRAGYAVGAGGEWMFAPKWSVKGEYLYYDLGSANYGTGNFAIDTGPTGFPGTGIAAVGTTTHVHFNGNIVRAGLNYHLN